MALRIYNTLSRQIGPFVSLEKGQVKMYVCGPTVYNHLHVGNFRGPIFFNLVRNWLEHLGYRVSYVFNYTDVDDKIIARAQQEGVSAQEISERYIQSFSEDFERLQLRDHDHRPKVTDFIPAIVDFVQQLLERGAAYMVEGEVFYSIQGFASYGRLSGKKVEDLIAGQRVEVDQRKQHPGDFVLWKPAKPGELFWDSPWGKGRPGWHIECSTMIQKILGETIDIHGGAIDLIFPHHENEIAQGEGRTGKSYCKYWMHHDFINMGDEKMSKSQGNIILARDFMDRYHPEILKYLFLSVHYRSLLSIGKSKVFDAMAALSRIYQSLAQAQQWQEGSGKGPCALLVKAMEQAEGKITAALNDDFNTGRVMAAIFEVVRVFNSLDKGAKQGSAQAFVAWVRKWGKMMSLFNECPQTLLQRFEQILLTEKKIDREQVEQLVAQRQAARAQKDWAKADAIRGQLEEMGIEITDGVGGKEWKVSVD